MAYPPLARKSVVVAVAVYRAPAVETLLRANADQAAGARRAAPPVQPLGVRYVSASYALELLGDTEYQDVLFLYSAPILNHGDSLRFG